MCVWACVGLHHHITSTACGTQRGDATSTHTEQVPVEGEALLGVLDTEHGLGERERGGVGRTENGRVATDDFDPVAWWFEGGDGGGGISPCVCTAWCAYRFPLTANPSSVHFTSRLLSTTKSPSLPRRHSFCGTTSPRSASSLLLLGKRKGPRFSAPSLFRLRQATTPAPCVCERASDRFIYRRGP